MLNSSILVVEDDPVTRELLRSYFAKAGYKVFEASSGVEMWDTLSPETVDLVLLDINLPGEDGLTLTRNIRSTYGSDICIILVSARTEDIDKIIGLELGADDYVTKPFNERELLVRVKNLLRRTSVTQKEEGVPNHHTFHGWNLDSEQRRLTSPTGEQVHLTNGEFLLLSTFLRHPSRVFDRSKLLEAVSSREWMPTDRTIDVMVNRLRRKLEVTPKEPKIIITVHGVGYQFVPEA
jgi:two-component system, OmpR family, torCAD operon response regulator TorR